MRGVGGNVQRLPGARHGFCAAEGGFYLPFQDGEGLLEIVPVRGWAAPGRNVHVDQAEAASRVLAGEEHSVSVPN